MITYTYAVDLNHFITTWYRTQIIIYYKNMYANSNALLKIY
jgi:hypothetical protein